MSEFKDPTGVARVAMVALGVYMASKLLLTLLQPGASPGDPVVGLLALVYLVALLACYVLVGWWIYRTNANAHTFTSTMAISPGWSIGWFFVPFANLAMPYQGVKEVWQESHRSAGLHEEAESSLVGWWWGLWIASNVASNLAVWTGGYSAAPGEGLPYFSLISAGVSIAASLVLIQMMRQLNRAQLTASHGSVFE